MSVNKDLNTSGISLTQFDSALEDALAEYEKVISDLKSKVADQAQKIIEDPSLNQK